MEQDIKAAQSSGDVAALIKLMAKASDITPQDFIRKTCGSLLYIYYTFLDKFHIKPKDMDDLIDGILYIEASNFFQKKMLNDMKP